MVMALLVALACGAAYAARPDLSVLPARVRGVVLLPDGETPVSGLQVRLWNAESEEVIFRSRTNKDGVFEVPKMTEGSHYVTVGPVRIDMRILTARAGVTPQPHGLVVVVPKRLPMMPVLIPGATAMALPRVMSP
ncbi:MAG: carboxypeptidase regulatory-like domain-containing protein [Kiritimatiellae bacterium]|nr:carboxypeptidase regulatory-like domain-containing protein [Kiritimatiellia bacterium]